MDVRAIAVMIGLANIALAAVLILAARVGPKYAGPSWWACAQATIALGLVLRNLGGESFLSMLAIPASLTMLAGGTGCLYVGLLRFFGRRVRKLPLVASLLLFFAWCAWFTFGANLIHIRGDALYLSDVVILYLCAYVAWRHGRGAVRASAHLLAGVFFVMSIVYLGLLVDSIAKGASTKPLFEVDPALLLAYAVTLVGTILWTFGFVLMVSQKLQGELAQEAANLETVFATSPDAAVLTRMVDGQIINVNVGFTELTGYTREEAVSNSTVGLGIWVNQAERERLLAEVARHGSLQGVQRTHAAQRRGVDGLSRHCEQAETRGRTILVQCHSRCLRTAAHGSRSAAPGHH